MCPLSISKTNVLILDEEAWGKVFWIFVIGTQPRGKRTDPEENLHEEEEAKSAQRCDETWQY